MFFYVLIITSIPYPCGNIVPPGGEAMSKMLFYLVILYPKNVMCSKGFLLDWAADFGGPRIGGDLNAIRSRIKFIVSD